jgi:hypothetical protein
MFNVIIFQASGELAVKNLEAVFIEDLELETPENSWFMVSPNQYVGEELEPRRERIFRVEFVDGDQSKSVLVTATAFVSGVEATTTKSIRAKRATS